VPETTTVYSERDSSPGNHCRESWRQTRRWNGRRRPGKGLDGQILHRSTLQPQAVHVVTDYQQHHRHNSTCTVQ